MALQLHRRSVNVNNVRVNDFPMVIILSDIAEFLVTLIDDERHPAGSLKDVGFIYKH